MEVQQAGKVRVSLQIIDLEARRIRLELPTYVPARDLSRQIARDSGLPAFWEDRTLRRYWIWARGRLMQQDETLGDLGVVDGELLHILPEPRPGEQAVEQPVDLRRAVRRLQARPLEIAVPLSGAVALAVLWGWGLSASGHLLVLLVPGLWLGALSATAGWRLLGGDPRRLAPLGLGVLVAVLLAVLGALAVPVLLGRTPDEGLALLPGGLAAALAGAAVGWVAWWGRVAPIVPSQQPVAAQADAAAQAQVACGICGLQVDPAVQSACLHGCGRVFHEGCHRAALAAGRRDPSRCDICGQALA